MSLISKCRCALAAWLVCLYLTGCTVAAPPSIPAAPDAQAKVMQALLQAHNAERAKYGQPPLVLDPALCTFAQNHANWMTTHGLQHGPLPPGGHGAGENIAQGQPSVASVMQSWDASSGHHANIVGNYSKVGFGWAWGSGGWYWSVEFLQP